MQDYHPQSFADRYTFCRSFILQKGTYKPHLKVNQAGLKLSLQAILKLETGPATHKGHFSKSTFEIHNREDGLLFIDGYLLLIWRHAYWPFCPIKPSVNAAHKAE